MSQRTVTERMKNRDEQTEALSKLFRKEKTNTYENVDAEDTINFVERSLVNRDGMGSQNLVDKPTIPPQFIPNESLEENIEEQDDGEPIRCDYW